jgi:leader peptidase (prepilin peptidase)/N-methyltransferase
MSSAQLADVAAAFPWFFPAVFFVLGACVGSFLNVVIHRVPAGKSVVHPGSHCACGAPIAWYDNIPIASWFLRLGRARCCGRRFSFRYPFVELLTALLFVACWMHFPAAKAAVGCLFVSVLLAALFIDLDHFIIPDVFSLGAGCAGILLSFAVPTLHGHHGDLFIVDSLRSGIAGLQGLLVGSGLVLWVALLAEAVLKKEAMGFGDVKFVGMIGAFCGWQGAVFSLFGGAVVGTIWFTLALIWQKIAGGPAAIAPKAETAEGQPAELALGVQVPFGPMLAIAAGAYFLFLRGPVDAWFGQLGGLL